MFTIIGERINMSRKRIGEHVRSRDADYVARQIKRQQEAGATHIDVNAGGAPASEVDDMKWLAETAAAATELPLSFDSVRPDALRAGLEICNRPGTIINSITAEKERVEGVLPLVGEFNTGVVCLTMDDDGMPEDYDGRMKCTRDIAALLLKEGIGLDRAYFDHLIRPAATNPGQAPFILAAVADTRKQFPDAHICMGLSNISFGVPQRNNLNRAWLAMLVAAGADGAIIDPCEEGMMNALLSSRAVLGLDDYCMDYVTAFREGKL